MRSDLLTSSRTNICWEDGGRSVRKPGSGDVKQQKKWCLGRIETWSNEI